ncbi:MAG: hypothetical protein CR968_05930 [Flavobacteriia bacterium]|nr:MAG: hypothetical protein CR968_05930 [Flavobacteriia bacterium]
MEDNNQNLYLSESAKAYLKETAGWAKFLAIVGFVMLGLMVIAGFSMGALFSAMPQLSDQPGVDMPRSFGAAMGFIYLIIALIYFFPLYFLFKFSTNIKQAIETNDEQVLTESFNFLKRHYKYVGIMMIIVLGIYVLMFLLVMLGMGAGAMM